MTHKLYKGSGLIKKIFQNSVPIKRVYRGTAEIWVADPYEPGANVFYQTGPGTFETELEAGVYDLIIAGGGGADYRWNFQGWYFHNHGGSGAAWEGTFYNPTKQTCKIYAGAAMEASYFELGGVRMITAGQGGNGGGASGSGGAAGVISVNGALQIVEQRKSSNGIKPSSGQHNEDVTASVCSLNVWGQGSGNTSPQTYIAGGARLQYVRLEK